MHEIDGDFTEGDCAPPQDQITVTPDSSRGIVVEAHGGRLWFETPPEPGAAHLLQCPEGVMATRALTVHERHAAMRGRDTAAAWSFTSVSRASAKAARAISRSRTATSKNVPVETRFPAIPTSHAMAM